MNSVQELIKLKQNFQKKALLFELGPVCNAHFVCLNIGFRKVSFIWKYCVFNLSFSTKKRVLQFCEKDFHF